MSKSWKTSLFGAGGIVTVIAATASAYFDADPTTNPDWGAVAGVIMAALGLFFARDNNVTSESAGAKP